MTRRLAIVHALPLDAAGDHVASTTCPCRPIEAADMVEPARLVVVHRHVPPAPASTVHTTIGARRHPKRQSGRPGRCIFAMVMRRRDRYTLHGGGPGRDAPRGPFSTPALRFAYPPV